MIRTHLNRFTFSFFDRPLTFSGGCATPVRARLGFCLESSRPICLRYALSSCYHREASVSSVDGISSHRSRRNSVYSPTALPSYFTLHRDPSAAQHRMCMRLSCSWYNGSEVVRRVDRLYLLLLRGTRMTHDGVYKQHGVYRCQPMRTVHCFVFFLRRRRILSILSSAKNRSTLGVSSLSESLSVCSSDASSAFRVIDNKLFLAEKKV
jgi:hypothetical protein